MKVYISVMSAMLVLQLLLLVPVTAQEGPDEWEPNDDIELADVVSGLIIEGEIGRQGDIDDWFVLEGQEGYLPVITLIYDDDRCDIDLEVYSDDDWIGDLISSYSPDSDEFDVPGECFIHVWSADGHGEYTIEIEPADEDDRDRDRDRRGSSDCEGDSEYEPNDDWGEADLISGFEIEGYACDGEDDWFVLDGQEGYYPNISLEYNDDECDIDLEIYSGSGRDRDYVGDLSSVASPDVDEFEVMETCYIRVYAYDGEGEYFIEIMPVAREDESEADCEGPDEWEPNDHWEVADEPSNEVFEGYACEDDDDWFVVEIPDGYYPIFMLYYDDEVCDIDIDIYLGSGEDEDYVGSLSSTTSPDVAEYDIEGTCYIRVYAWDGEGEYEIEVELER